MCIAAGVASIYGKSALKGYIDSKSFFNKPWSHSLISGIADNIFSAFCFLEVKACKLLKKISEHSLLRTVFDKTAGKLGYSNLLALIFAAMFLCYGTWWNNMYALIFAVLMFAALVYKCRDNQMKPSQMDFFVVLFIISIVLGVIAAPNKSDAVRVALFAVTALLFMLCTALSLDSENKVSGFLKIISVAIAVTAVVAIIQRLMEIEVNQEFVDVSANEGMPGRVFSTMENPNNYAEILVLFMPFMYALFTNAKKGAAKLLWVVVTAVTLVALVMTYSRSCYVAIALATVVFVLIYDFRLILPLMAVAVIAIPFMPETVMNRILTIGSLQDSSNSYRLYIWDTCVNLIVNYGVSGLGIGPEAFAALYKPSAHMAAVKAPHSHMLYMELILEFGIMGFIGFFAYYIRIIRNGLKCVKLADKTERAYIAAGVGALSGICFVSAAEYIWFYPRDMFAHFIVMGVMIAIVRNIKKKNEVAK